MTLKLKQTATSKTPRILVDSTNFALPTSETSSHLKTSLIPGAVIYSRAEIPRSSPRWLSYFCYVFLFGENSEHLKLGVGQLLFATASVFHCNCIYDFFQWSLFWRKRAVYYYLFSFVFFNSAKSALIDVQWRSAERQIANIFWILFFYNVTWLRGQNCFQ